jgi:peroxiredoxin
MDRLNDQLLAFKSRFLAELPDDLRQLSNSGLASMKASEVLRTAIGVGHLAPDFCLPSATAGSVGLHDTLDHGPVILSFFRGDWCPYCSMELMAYQKILPRLHQLGASVLAVSPLPKERLAQASRQQGLGFPLLSDANNAVARAYGLAIDLPDALRRFLTQLGLNLPQINGNDDWVLPVPATYVIAPSRDISLAYLDVDYSQRLEPIDALLEVKRLVASWAPGRGLD